MDNLSVYQSPSLTALLIESRAPIGVQTSANGAQSLQHREKENAERYMDLGAILFTAEQHVNQTLAGHKFIVVIVAVTRPPGLAAKAQTHIIF